MKVCARFADFDGVLVGVGGGVESSLVLASDSSETAVLKLRRLMGRGGLSGEEGASLSMETEATMKLGVDEGVTGMGVEEILREGVVAVDVGSSGSLVGEVGPPEKGEERSEEEVEVQSAVGWALSPLKNSWCNISLTWSADRLITALIDLTDFCFSAIIT
jgi:hypothetical protein